MAVDSSNALYIGGLSALVGFGVAYFTFKKLISDKYGKGKENENSIYYWCGLIAMFAFGQGLGTVINEVLFSLINSSSMNDDVIARGIFTLVFYPAVLAIVAFIISIFTSKQVKVVQEVASPDLQSASSFSFKFSKKFFLGLIGALVVGCGLLFLNFENFNFAKEKRFDFAECESCEFDGVTQKTECKKISDLGHFTVYENKLVTFIKRADGSSSVSSSPTNDDKCFFNANGKFSFNCTSVSGDQSQMFQSSKEFDGKQAYRSNWLWYILVGNTPKLAQESKLTCKMKG